MRGAFGDQGGLFSYISPEVRIPKAHRLRKVRALVRDVLHGLDRCLGKLYASEGRPSIPPEQLLGALLLQAFYGIRSERQLMEQLDYNLLYRWFVGLSPDDPVWDPTSFTKNRERLQSGEVFAKFMHTLLNHPQVKPLLSDEHFSVDGTLIEAWASQKSFRAKDGSGEGDGGANFHGQKRKNDTHASTSDPDSRLYRKAAGREAKLCYMGHATMENRHGLAVDGRVTHATGTAERRASETMLKARSKAAGGRITAGEDKAYDTADHVANLRAMKVTPHVTQNNAVTKTGKRRRSAIDTRTTRHRGYAISQSRRAMVECIFGWGKQHGTLRKTKHRGIARVAADFMLNLIAYNLIRIPKLLAA
jgi:transposase